MATLKSDVSREMEGPCPCLLLPLVLSKAHRSIGPEPEESWEFWHLHSVFLLGPTDIAIYLLKTLICTTGVLQELPARGVWSSALLCSGSQCGEVPPGSAFTGHHGTRLFLSFLQPGSTWSLLVPPFSSFLLSSPLGCSAPQVSDPCSGIDVEPLPGEGCVQLPWLRARVQDLPPIPLATASFGQAGMSGLSGQIKISSVFAVTSAPALPSRFSYLAPLGTGAPEVRETLQKLSRSKTSDCCRWKLHFSA